MSDDRVPNPETLALIEGLSLEQVDEVLRHLIAEGRPYADLTELQKDFVSVIRRHVNLAASVAGEV